MPLLEYGADSPQLGTVLLSLVAAFLSLFMAARPVSARKTGARVVSLALLASLSVIVGGPGALAVGLLAFAAGDALLMQEDQRALPAGFVCLAAGNAAYGTMLLPVATLAQFLAQPWLLLPFAVGVAAIAQTALRMTGLPRGLLVPVLLYLVTTLGLCLTALSTLHRGVALGCLLLLLHAVIAVRPRVADDVVTSREIAAWAVFYLSHLMITLFVLGLI